MATLLGVIIVLILLAVIVVQPLMMLFSRRYPRKQENLGRREPPMR